MYEFVSASEVYAPLMFRGRGAQGNGKLKRYSLAESSRAIVEIARRVHGEEERHKMDFI